MLKRVGYALTTVGLGSVMLGLGLWLLGGRSFRLDAVAAGAVGFIALCFGNAVSSKSSP